MFGLCEECIEYLDSPSTVSSPPDLHPAWGSLHCGTTLSSSWRGVCSSLESAGSSTQEMERSTGQRLTSRSRTPLVDSTSVPPSNWTSSYQSDLTCSMWGGMERPTDQ